MHDDVDVKFKGMLMPFSYVVFVGNAKPVERFIVRELLVVPPDAYFERHPCAGETSLSLAYGIRN